jgi:hypothetical protein
VYLSSGWHGPVRLQTREISGFASRSRTSILAVEKAFSLVVSTKSMTMISRGSAAFIIVYNLLDVMNPTV